MSSKLLTGLLIVFILIVAFILFASTSSRLLEWLWLSELGYEGVFYTILSTQAITWFAAFVAALGLLLWNFRVLGRQMRYVVVANSPLRNLNINFNDEIMQRRIRQLFTFAAFFIAFIFSTSFIGQWDHPLRFLNSAPMGEVDPLFGYDIAFYMFELPFWELIQTALAILVFLNLVVVLVTYIYTGMVSFSLRSGIEGRPVVVRQITFNVALWLLLVGWGFYLERYQLLYRSEGIVFGAGYTDVNVVLPALWVITFLFVLLAATVLASQWMRMGKAMLTSAGLVVLSLILGRGVIPELVQRFDVNANELERERPFLEHNIEMTRAAYGLDAVEEINYPAEDTLTMQDIRANQEAVDNIRLWDPRMLIRTYRQIQEIRPYYHFNDVDIDRYTINGRPQQVMLSARELASELPEQSDTWVNRHMQYTHGIGVTMSPVNRSNPQGEPLMFLRDIPPVASYPELEIENPAIYYGERSHHYYIVNTDSEELHYPQTGGNVYKHYAGEGGIPFSGWFRKLLFAWETGEINILLADEIHEASRFQMWRGVQERIHKIAPFLKLDQDPYLVMNDGRLFWVQDAYTTSSHFPYSEPSLGNENYIRNSVKIVIDAYHGSVDFYLVDEDDPVAGLYDNAFPSLFKSREEVPDGIEEHFRYPQNLFEVQLEQFNKYHMTNPRVFYNNEDRWARPQEHYAGRRQQMEPYYVLGTLPDEPGMHFMLMSPVTPDGRNNMISWMGAMSDPENYGRLVSYQLPRDRLIYGPAQIESRIDQDPEISRQISLWDQRGSSVIRGNLLAIPLERSFLYVEPVFLLADRDDIPQLQRVIVAIGEEISMQPTIEEAINDLFGVEREIAEMEEAISPLAGMAADETEAPAEMPVAASHNNLETLRSAWREVQEAMEAGDWTRFGEKLQELDDLID